MNRKPINSATKWLCVTWLLMMAVRPSIPTIIFAPETPATTICDARLFRQTVVSFCTFHRRDVMQPMTDKPHRYYYNVNEKESDKVPQGERQNYGRMVFTQLGKETLFFPVVEYSSKVKRHREFALHQKCCRNGCTAMDFAGVC